MKICRCFANVFGFHSFLWQFLLNGLWKFILYELHKILGIGKTVPKWYHGKKWPNLSRAKLFWSSALSQHNWVRINLLQWFSPPKSTWTLLGIHYRFVKDELWNFWTSLINIWQKHIKCFSCTWWNVVAIKGVIKMSTINIHQKDVHHKYQPHCKQAGKP